jgi:single-strand DNA-binding protein
MNKFYGIGNLTKDVELRATQSGKAVASFTIAVNRRFKNQAGEAVTDFFPVTVWGQLAEVCGRYLAKGKKVAVVGELQTRSYDDKQGVKRYVTEIVADEVEFLSPKEHEVLDVATMEDYKGGDDLPF